MDIVLSNSNEVAIIDDELELHGEFTVLNKEDGMIL